MVKNFDVDSLEMILKSKIQRKAKMLTYKTRSGVATLLRISKLKNDENGNFLLFKLKVGL